MQFRLRRQTQLEINDGRIHMTTIGMISVRLTQWGRGQKSTNQCRGNNHCSLKKNNAKWNISLCTSDP